jgi:hypothetical protein
LSTQIGCDESRSHAVDGDESGHPAVPAIAVTINNRAGTRSRERAFVMAAS